MDAYDAMPAASPRQIRRSKHKSSTRNKHRKSEQRNGVESGKRDRSRQTESNKARSRSYDGDRESYTGNSSMQNVDLSLLLSASKAPSRRKDSLKTYKTSRMVERDRKASAGDLTDLLQHTDSLDKQYISEPSKVTSNASTIPQPLCDNEDNDLKSSSNTGSRTVPATPLECPQDRINFYRTFSLLVNLGTSTRKEKEKRIAPYARQLSSEQEEWQSELNDLIWLELQAWREGYTPHEQHDHLIHARNAVPAVLECIVNFRIIDPMHVQPDDDCDTSTDRQRFLDSCLETPLSDMPLNESCVAQQMALVKVGELLHELEGVERLYPSMRALGREHSTYHTLVFQQRVETLCLWMNITNDIAHKLQLMAKVLRVDTIEGLRWPWKEVRLSLSTVITDKACLRLPEIQVTADSSDSESDENSEEGRAHVQFDVSSDEADVDGTTSPRTLPANTDGFTRTSIYRHFVENTLKKTSLCKLLTHLKRLLAPTLQRACDALEVPKVVLSYADIVSQQTLSPSPIASRKSSCASLDWSTGEMGQPSLLAARGVHSSAFTDMGLPSFKASYLFLVRILLDVIHECLRLRLEHRPEMEPSLLSVRQLIHECKEVLLGAVRVKQYYQEMVMAVTVCEGLVKTKLDLELYEEDMKQMLEVYFDYIHTWVSGLQNLREMSKQLKSFLEDEWTFTKKVCPHIRSGETNAANRFCLMASSLLHSISDFIDTGMDECINELCNSTLMETSGESEQLISKYNRTGELRQAIIQTCRLFKILFHEARERASKALGFAKMLRKDLEIAADFNIASTAEELLQKLKETHHVRLVAPLSHGYRMFVPSQITDDAANILQLLNATCGRDGTTADCPAPDGYLILVRCCAARDGGQCCDEEDSESGGCPVWTGGTQTVEPTAETTIALSYMQVEGLLLVVVQSSQLVSQRDYFSEQMGSVVQLVSEQTSCHQAIVESLAELKTAAVDLRSNIATAISQVDDKLRLEDIADLDELEKIEKLYRETLHQCYSFGFEYHQEVTRLVSGEMRSQLSCMLVAFAKQWMQFVSKKCERGRGLRPRWASQGLDFLIVACEQRVLAMLTETEYLELKKCINNCISHVIGDKGSALGQGYRSCGSPDVNSQRRNMSRLVSCPEPGHTASGTSRRSSVYSARSAQSEPPYSPLGNEFGDRRMTSPAVFASEVQLMNGEDGGLVAQLESLTTRDGIDGVMDYNARIQCSIEHIETERNAKLYARHAIGKVTRWKGDSDYMTGSRRVNFKWQRGNKIGEGQYGKVYAAVNMETGELMAIKELTFQANDQRSMKYIADEIKIFESISHPNLVKYYGTEVHRGEMLIFMEYCAEGTIEEVAKQGLSEGMVRKYTSQILIACNVLHEHGIVHRDIKGANIFLTSNGPLKLGDFGSAVQLRTHNTLPGEVGPMVGTAAFMAPEVITRHHTEGTGRAADIWSIGCVVLQMITGKRPWSEMENKVTIMFRVGQGGIPPFPDHLSDEGQNFLSHCLLHDPEDRWTASRLLDHPFVKVYVEDEEAESIFRNC